MNRDSDRRFFSDFDALFLSNGPGDPQTQCPETIATISSWINSDKLKPVFGICLGHQVSDSSGHSVVGSTMHSTLVNGIGSGNENSEAQVW